MSSETKNPKTSRLGDMKMIIFQVLLGINTLLILLVVGVVLKLVPNPTLMASPTTPEPVVAPEADPLPQAESGGEGLFSPTSPAWRDAERAFHTGDYSQAHQRYTELALQCRQVPAERLVHDYFTLRIAQCLRRTGKTAEAQGLFEKVSQSLSPVVRAMGYYGLALQDYDQDRFLSARSNAYRAAGALESLEKQLPLLADCDFLVNQALTEKVRTFRSTDRFTPWPHHEAHDPFVNLTRDQLRELLAEGASRMNPSVLGSEFQAARIPGQTGLWQARADRVTIEEALNQFAAQADRDIRWMNVSEKVRRRSVDMYFSHVGPQRYCEIIAGASGLVSRFTLEQVLIHDPMEEPSANAQMELLAREAISSWRLFFLRYPKDPRVPMGHFALAAISEWQGKEVEAMREFALLARRFEEAAVAPDALLRSAQIKLKLQDLSGARRDLNDLLDLYPDHAGIDDVYLLLGDVTEKAGQLTDAAELYERLYLRNFSPDSRRRAAYGAGRCHFNLGTYDMASVWLARFLAMIPDARGLDYTRGYFLLGRAEAYQGNLSVAAQAFQRGLAGMPDEKERVDALIDLAAVRISQEDYVLALGVLGDLGDEALGPEQTVAYIRQLSRVCREIGILDRARTYLRIELSRTDDPKTRAQIGLELAKCHMESRDNAAARQLLTEIMPDMPDGASTFDAATLLAEACLALGEADQAISVAEPILQQDPDPTIAARLRRVLGEAWLAKDDYAKAVTYFSASDVDALTPGPASDGEVTP